MNRFAEYLRFFFGTPQRFLVTVASVTVVWGIFNPQAVGNAIRALGVEIVNAVSPMVEPVLTIFFLVIALGILWKAVFGRRGGGGAGR